MAAVFGALVGTLTLLARGHHVLSVLIPMLATTIVSALTFVAVKESIVEPGLHTMIAPLITFLPGGMLTTATVKLASGEMAAGTSRLVSGGMQLLLLAFGIIAGVELAGLPSENVLDDTQVNLLGWWGAVARRPPLRHGDRGLLSPRRVAPRAGCCSSSVPRGSASSRAACWWGRTSAASSARS